MDLSNASEGFRRTEAAGAQRRRVLLVTTSLSVAVFFGLVALVIRRDGAAPGSAQRRQLGETATPPAVCPDLPPRPPYGQKERRARWMVHSLDWGVLSTISTRITDASSTGAPIPFGNVYSFADGPCSASSGVPYLFASDLDQSMKDIAKNSVVSLTLSEAELPGLLLPDECAVGSYGGYGDPENPPCARLVLTGDFVRLSPPSDGEGTGADNEKEWKFAQDALARRHPSLAKMPANHMPFIAKIFLKDIWFIDMYGGASVLDLDEYYAVDLAESDENDAETST